MRPGLFRWPTDFGNGAADRCFFQSDGLSTSYRRAKARIITTHPERCWLIDDDTTRSGLTAVADWMDATAPLETGAPPSPALDLRDRFLYWAATLSEDFAIVQRTPTGDRLVLSHVCFPSGWRPEATVGASFTELHRAVPEFSLSAKATAGMLTAMIERGPYTRFVWTLCADADLDHHPSRVRTRLSDARAYPCLRVERQISVPFTEHRVGLFLIRTYRYPIADLREEQRCALVAALKNTSKAVLRYKGLFDELSSWISLLSSNV